jgi:hypothetical protein
MDAFDLFARIVGSPLFQVVAVLAVVGASVYGVITRVREQQRLVAFMQAHGFRWTDTGSTMWLARLIERWDLQQICGHFDGRWVEVRSRRGGRTIVVTADRDLVSRDDCGVVSLGAWTRPQPPAPLVGLSMNARDRQLQVHVGSDYVPFIVAAVAYTKALEDRPVDPNASRTPP